MPEEARSPEFTSGARWGMTIGFNAWWIALVILFLISGHAGALLETIPALAGTSMGLCLIAILLFDFAFPYRTQNPRFFQFLLWGFLLLSIGILILLFHQLVAPVIDADSDLQDTMNSMQSVWRFPPVVPILLMAAGIACLALALLQKGRSQR